MGMAPEADPPEARLCGGAAGLLMMAASAFCFSVMSVFVHFLASVDRIPAIELVGMRGAFGLCVSLAYLFAAPEARGVSLWAPPEHRRTLALRCAFGICGISSNWYVLSQLPLGDATVIIFTAPVFTAVLATVLLGETVTPAEAALMTLSTCGVLLVARPAALGFEGDVPPSYATSPRGAVFAVGMFGAFCSAMTNLLVRRLAAVHAMVTVSWLFATNTLAAPVLLWALGVSPSSPRGVTAWLCVLGVGVFGFAGQGTKTLGLKWEKAGPGAMMRNLDIVFAFAWQRLVFDEPARALSLAGAALTLTSSLAIGAIKLRRRRAEKARLSPPPTDQVDGEGGKASLESRPKPVAAAGAPLQ